MSLRIGLKEVKLINMVKTKSYLILNQAAIRAFEQRETANI
jgi:hypothetical protein